MAKHHERTTLEEKAVLTLLLYEHDVHAFDDLPSGILASFGIFWTILAALFWIFFAADTGSRFAITVAILFIGFFFSVPTVMARQAKPRLVRPVNRLMIWTGPISEQAAAVQILLIPAALILAIFAMGVIRLAVT